VPTNLTPLVRVDSATLKYTDFEPSFQTWLSVLVDTLNEDMNLIEAILASLDARITALGG
jgi:hypothetical protein